MSCSCSWCRFSVQFLFFSSFIEKALVFLLIFLIPEDLGLTWGLEFCSDRACRIERGGFAFESFIVCGVVAVAVEAVGQAEQYTEGAQPAISSTFEKIVSSDPRIES